LRAGPGGVRRSAALAFLRPTPGRGHLCGEIANHQLAAESAFKAADAKNFLTRHATVPPLAPTGPCLLPDVVVDCVYFPRDDRTETAINAIGETNWHRYTGLGPLAPGVRVHAHHFSQFRSALLLGAQRTLRRASSCACLAPTRLRPPARPPK